MAAIFFQHNKLPRVYDDERDHDEAEVIITGFGRFSVQLFRQQRGQTVVRELLGGSLSTAVHVLQEYGFSDAEVQRMVQVFQRHDEETLEKSL